MQQDIIQNNQQIPSLLNNVLGQQQSRNNESMMQNIFGNQNFPNQQQVDFNQLNSPPQFQNFNLPPPDFSRPPPGFNLPENSAPVVEEVVSTEPTLPFFELPAGLMVPLVSLEDYNYHGIDSDKLQLPVPLVPSEKLLNAIENFYAAPSHERPRDNEGWEKLGLYEYFKIKNAVRKQKEEAIANFEREKSKSPSPIPETLIKPAKKTRKRVYRSKSPEKRSKSRSASPEKQHQHQPQQQVKVVAKSRPKRRSRSPSPANYRNFNRDSRNDRNRKRSITPPSFSVTNRASEFIDEGNKGHQLLKKLGWKEGGLGAGNQGIVQPISGGEIRDRLDLYKVKLQTI
jgi:calcium homeostasis endoplasmic reticulum protein